MEVNKSQLKKNIIILTTVITFFLIGFSIYQIFFSISINNIPKGDFINEVVSPNETYSIKIYVVNGGATVDYAVRGELVYKKQERKSQNIYWNYHEDSAEVSWIDDTTVRINGKTLNVLKDRYDFRTKN